MKKLVWAAVLCISCASFLPRSSEDYEATLVDEDLAIIYERGNSYFKAMEYKNAIKEFKKILDRHKDTHVYEPALYLTAFSFYRLNNYKNAASLGERFIKEFPSSSYALNAASLVGESFFQRGDDYKAAYYLTTYHTQTEDSTGLKKSFSRIIEILPELTLKQLEKLHRLFMAEPIDEHILYHLAQNEAREGKKKDAERDFNLLLRRFPNTRYTLEVEEYKRFIDLGEATGRAGVLLSLSGEYAQAGQQLLDIIRRFERNRQLPFSLHYLDTKSDPTEATIAAAKLIEDMHVDFLIAPIRLIEAFGVCGVAYGKGIPVILPMTSETKLEAIPLVITPGQDQIEQAKLIAQYAMYDLGIREFAILCPDHTRYRNIANVFASEVAKHNREVVAMVSFQTDSITLKKEIAAVKRREPGAIFLAMDKDMIINVTPQIAYYGLEGITLLGIDTFMDEKVPRLGEKYVEGAVFAAPSPIDSLTLRVFTKEGYKEGDFSAKFFYTLWRLKELKRYNRNVLPDLISKLLKENVVMNIYQITNGDFLKLAEISE